MSGLNLKQKFLGAAAGALLLGLSAQVANAATINSILLGGTDTTPQLSDNSAEYLINPIGVTDTTVDVGDRLRGVLSINTIENPGTNAIGIGSGNSELSALFDVVVTGKTCTAPGVNCTFTFGAYAPFATEVDTLGSGGFANVTGAAVAFFEDFTPDFTRVGGIAAGEASAIDGNAFWLFGFDGVDDFWVATTATDDISDVILVPPPGTFGDLDAGLSLLDNPFGIDLGNVSCLNPSTFTIATVNACASGGVIAPDNSNTGFQAWDNVDFQIALVPEPGTLSLVGFGLLGLGYRAFRRNRRQKKA
jgi:hypothetical protein